MWVYFVLLFIPLIVQHVVLKRNHVDLEKKNRNALSAFFLLFTILVMLRHESVGSDTRNYIYFFGNYSRMSWLEIAKDNIEVGFSYYNKIVSLFSNNPQFFLAVSAILTVAMIYYTYQRLNLDASLTIMLFCTMSTFVMMFSGIRQMLAVGIGVVAYEFVRKKKLVPFILLVIIAVTFHMSAFMIAFMYPLYHAKITKKWLYAVVPSLVVMFVFNRQIFSFLGLIIERYTDYDASIVQTGAYTMLILFSVFAVFAFLIPDESLLDEETIGLRNFLLLSIVVQMFAPLHTLAMRMSYYYIIFIPLLIPKIIACRSERWSQVGVVSRHIMLAFFVFYFFLNAYSGSNLHVFPYHFFWEAV